MTGFALTFVASYWVAAFFHEEQLVPIVKALSVSFLLQGSYALPQSRLIRELSFDKKAKVDVATLAASVATSLSCALLGFGVWSLVAATLVSHAARAIGFNWMAPTVPMSRLSLTRGSRFLRFGGVVVLSRALWFFSANVDVIIAGVVLGTDVLGVYSVALMVASIPLDKVTPVITQVAFPAVARIQHDTKRVQHNVLKGVRYGNSAFMPVFWGMALVGADGLPLLLGGRWNGAALPFQLICIVLPLKALSALLPPALFGLGRPMVNVMNMATSVVLMSAGMFVGVQFGLRGLAMVWVIVYPVAFAINTARALPVVGLRWHDIVAEICPSFLAAAAMSAAVCGVQYLAAESTPMIRVSAAVICGAVTYLGTLARFDRSIFREIRALVAR